MTPTKRLARLLGEADKRRAGLPERAWHAFTLVLLAVGTGLVFAPTLGAMQAGVLLVWSGGVIYAALAPWRRVMLLAFLGTFFLFLLGRDSLIDFFGFPRTFELTHAVEFHARLTMVLGLLAVLGGYVIADRLDRRRTTRTADSEARNAPSTNPSYRDHPLRAQVGRLALILFYIALPLSQLSKGLQAAYVLRHGYYAYYTDYVVMRQDDILLLALSKIEYMLPAALAALLAALPPRRSLILPFVGWLVYCVLALATGMRFTTMGGIMLILVYLVARQGSLHLIGKRVVLVGAAALPVLAGGLAWLGYARAGERPEFSGPLSAIPDFLYQQGVTANMVKYAKVLEAQIPENKLYSLEFLFTGLIGRAFGTPIYYGNNYPHALEGHSFAHILSLRVLGEESYFSGRSTGTSYLAELYHDFGYVGVVLGSLVIGALLMQVSLIDRVRSQPFVTFLRVILIYDLLWLPRGNFGAFLTRLTAPSTLAVIAAVFLGAWIIAILLRRGHSLPRGLGRLLVPQGAQSAEDGSSPRASAPLDSGRPPAPPT